MNSSSELAGAFSIPRRSEQANGAIHANAILVAYAILCCLSLLPFVLIGQPPIVDFANHAARLTLACHPDDPAIAAMYRYQFGIIPNLAIDLVNRPLCGTVSPSGVLRLVTAGSLSLIYFSGWLIQRKLFGRPNAFLFLLPAIAFNLVTTMGYINFLAGVAVACLLVALVIGREQRFGALLMLCNAAGIAIFFCHVFALAFAMLLVFGLLLRGSGLNPSKLAGAGVRTVALFAIPLVLLMFVPSAHEPLTFGYHHKARMMPALFMAQHRALGVYGLLLIMPLVAVLREKTAELAPMMRLPLLVAGLFALLVPSNIREAVDIDSRMLVALAYLFFAALRPLRHERAFTLSLGGLALTAIAFQLCATATVWTAFSRQVDELRRASDILPAEAKVFTVAGDSGAGLVAAPLAYSHVTSYVTIERRIFNPLDFTGVGMQPLSVTPRFAGVDTPTGQPYSPQLADRFIHPDAQLQELAIEGEASFALRWPDKFDYVIFYHFGAPYNFDPAQLREIRRGSFFSIFKVVAPRSASPGRQKDTAATA